MPELTQSAFTSGELDPSLHRRLELAKFDSGATKIENFFVHTHGGVSNRPGFEFVAEVKDSSAVTRLIPFEFNTEQTYIIEVGNLYMRFIKDGAQITESNKTITGATQANPVVITSSSHGYSNGDEIYITGVVGMTSLNGGRFTIANKTTNTFELAGIDGTGFSSYTSGGVCNRIFEIATPYPTADIPNLKFTQSADTMTICHTSHAPRNLTRTGHTAWTLSTITFGATTSAPGSISATATGSGSTSWEYTVTAVDENTAAESVAGTPNSATNAAALTTTAFNTITWAAVTGAASYNVYIKKGGIFQFIGTADALTFKDDGIAPDPDVSPPQNKTIFNTTNEFPATTAYYKQRQVYAQTNNNPQNIFLSVIGDFPNFNTSLPLKDDDAITYRLVCRQVNEIRHLVPLDDLIILTSGGEWIGVGDDSGVVSPLTFNVTIEEYTGASDRNPPIIVNNSVVFVEARGESVRDLGYKLDVDGYTGNDLTILVRHLFEGFTISEWTFAKVPYSIIWAVRNDGMLLGLTYNREQEVFAWHRHVLGGNFGECTITVTDFANIAVGTTLALKKSDGTTVTFTSEAVSGSAPDETLGFRPNTNNNTTADNIFTAINAHADFVVENPAANVVTIRETLKTGSGLLTIVSSDTTRLATTDQAPSVVESVSSTPETFDANEDGVYVIVKRTIGGTTKRYIERLKKRIFATKEDSFFVDSGLTYDSTPVSTITGLDHLEGQTVSILADGNILPRQKVSNGSVSLGSLTFSKVHVGLPITATIEMLPLDVVLSSARETSVSRQKNATEMTLFLEDTTGLQVGKDVDNLVNIAARQFETFGSPAELKSDEICIKIGPEWKFRKRPVITQSQPVPAKVLGVSVDLALGG